MDPNQPELVLGAYALSYLVHSTLLIVGVWLSLRLLKLKSPRIREKLWRTALLGGLLTASLQFLLPLPHWGAQWFLGEPSEMGDGLQVRAPSEQPNIDVSGLAGASDSLHERSSRDSNGASASTGKNARWSFWRVAAWVWLGVVAIGVFRLGLQFYRFKQICRRSKQASQGIQSTLGELSQNMQHHGTVHCRSLSGLSGPIAAGWLNGWIILPEDLCRRLQPEQFRAVLAHELAHLARHDSWWSLLTHVVGTTFFFQPLNQLVRRQLRIEAEFLADQHALKVLPDSLGLAQSLIALGESLTKTPRGVPALASGMASYQSILGKRVESLVEPNQTSQRAAKWTARISGALALIIPVVILIAAPRVLATPTLNPNKPLIPMNTMNTMKRSVTLLAASLGLTAFEPAAKADEPEREAPRRAAESIAKVPESLRGFSGYVAGELVSKDVEKGELVMKLNRVLNVWKPNKAKEPSSGVGKTFRIDGVTGKFLDDLLVIKPGEFLKIEVHHVKGDDLAFLGEGLKKIPKEEGTLLAAEQAAWTGLKDFRGILIGKLVSKDTEKGTLVFKMEKVKKTWKADKAPDPTAAVGKELLVKGISGKWLDVLLLLEKDDRIEVEAFHNGNEHLDFVQEWLKKAEEEEKEAKE